MESGSSMTTPPVPPGKPFWYDPYWVALHLLSAGRMTREQYSGAVAAFKANSRRSFTDTLIALNLLTEQGYAQILAEKTKLPFTPVLQPVRDIARSLPKPRALQRAILPLQQDGPVLKIAVADPTKYTAADAKLDFPAPSLRFIFVVAPHKDILAALDTVWTDEAAISNTEEFLHQLLFRAIDLRSSDVHFEPKPNSLNIRVRVDGSLLHDSYVPEKSKLAVLQSVKIASRLDISEKRKPQDGQFHLDRGSNAYSFRVSTAPTVYGEKIVIRIADDNANLRPFNELGMEPDQIGIFRSLISFPDGVIICTGPTGSGKTTLLYSAVDTLPTNTKNVHTVEDPVEYSLPTITQTPVNPDIGVTFASVLRAILRQDPDIIVVGEIRDTETAKITTQAALTGHLVLTTLHTNDAAGAVTRLIDMGVDPFIVSSTVKGVLAQRLLRRLCVHCKTPHPQNAEMIERFDMPPETQFFAACGCDQCRGTGYRGRVGIFEIFPLHEPGDSDAIRERNAVVNRIITNMGSRSNPTTERDLLNEMLTRGHRSLRRDGLLKASQGLTSPEEVLAYL